MTCPRCQGLMCKEYAVSNRYSDTSAWLWACINCSERIDEVILLNRRLQAEFNRLPMKQRERIWMQIQMEVGQVG